MAMDLNAKAAYIRGLMTGMEFDADSKNGKVIAAMMDLLEEMAAQVTEHDDALDQVYDELETLDQDVDDIVSDLYADDDDEDEDEHAHHHHHHHHHGHDADEVFISWTEETHKKFTKAEIERILKALEDADTYGIVLRAKGYVANAEGEKWIHFDYVPGEPDIRDGGAMVTGRICVIGSKLNEEAVAKLFGVEKQ